MFGAKQPRSLSFFNAGNLQDCFMNKNYTLLTNFKHFAYRVSDMFGAKQPRSLSFFNAGNLQDCFMNKNYTLLTNFKTTLCLLIIKTKSAAWPNG